MAATYRPIDAFDICKRFIKNMPLEQVQVRVLDSVSKVMWMAAPWRWSIGSLPNITLVANTQDYTVALPADFLYAVTSYVTDQNGGSPRDLEIVPSMPVGGLVGQVSRVAFTGTAGTNGTARFFPKPVTLPTGTQTVISMYKKTAPVITPANVFTAGTLVFDDEWTPVYEAGVLWLSYLFADDTRAGSAQADGRGTYSFTGQRAVFEANIQLMKEREKLLIVDPRMVPDAKASR